MLPKINAFVKEVEDLIVESQDCVLCNSRKAALCPYCFSDRVFNMLKKEKVDKNIIGDFLGKFNFDEDHTGYIMEAEKQGLY